MNDIEMAARKAITEQRVDSLRGSSIMQISFSPNEASISVRRCETVEDTDALDQPHERSARGVRHMLIAQRLPIRARQERWAGQQ